MPFETECACDVMADLLILTIFEQLISILLGNYFTFRWYKKQEEMLP